MPGVGVVPFLRPFFSCSELGIPGVDDRPGTGVAALSVIPAGSLPFVGNGVVESPGGILFGSIFISTGPFVFLLVLELDVPVGPHPKLAAKAMEAAAAFIFDI